MNDGDYDWSFNPFSIRYCWMWWRYTDGRPDYWEWLPDECPEGGW